MRILVVASLIALGGLSLDAPAAAKEPAWCAVYRTGGTNCGFHTHEQCMATVSGIGGFCNRSPYAEPEKPAARREQAVESNPGARNRNARRRHKNPRLLRPPRNRRPRRRPPPPSSRSQRRRQSPRSRLRLPRCSRQRPPRSSKRASERRARSFSPANIKPASKP